jgi:hypothetical protein
MSPLEYWDCPLPLWSGLGAAALSLGIFMVALHLYHSRRVVGRILGGCLLTIAAVLYFGFGNYIIDHGIRLGNDPLTSPPLLRFVIILGWFGASGFLLGRRSSVVCSPQSVRAPRS